MNHCPLVWIIIGVSGSGKTLWGRLLAEKLECDFLEGDRRHPPENIIKMSSQQPLQEKDRLPWLLEIEDDIRRAIDKNREIVITCSALKAAYRNQLTALGRVQLVWIDVAESLLAQRIEKRLGHYMGSGMLTSQIAAFEAISPQENVMTIDGGSPIDEVMNEFMDKAVRQFPKLQKDWWVRCIE